MHKHRSSPATILLFFSFLCCVALSCTSPKADQPMAKPKYLLYLLNKNAPNSFISTDAIDTTGQESRSPIPTPIFSREYINHNGSLFFLNYDTEHFVKYSLDESNQIKAVDSLQFDYAGDLENFHWRGKSDTLLLFTVKREKNSTGYINIIDTKTMTLLSKRVLPLPRAAAKGFNLLNIGVADVYADKLWIGYSYSKYLANESYTTSDTMYFSTLDLNSLALEHTQKDVRSAYPGGINTVQSYAAKDERGDLYFMSCPGVALGNRIDAPTAIFRKRTGESEVDTDYMINISEKIGNHAYGFWYIGQGKAIIRSERRDRYTDFSNHHSTYQFEYYVVDLETMALRKLDLPLDKGTRKENVLIESDFVYIGIDDEQDNHAIWSFEKKSGTIKKTITLSNTIDFILRLDALK